MLNTLQSLVFAQFASAETVATSATFNSSAVDTQGKGDLIVVIEPTATTGAASAVKLQESDDGSTGWADISGAALTTLPSGTDDGKYFGILLTKQGTAHKRYVRLVWTQSGTGSSTINATGAFSHPQEFPSSAADAGFDGGLVIA